MTPSIAFWSVLPLTRKGMSFGWPWVEFQTLSGSHTSHWNFFTASRGSRERRLPESPKMKTQSTTGRLETDEHISSELPNRVQNTVE
ncbi:hypothetical protein GEV33_003581 [Tenebrio molitor]|uniref:Uncharacterized protein n=1 Tax=Tenebrio molitor TaxID=7067 RepID=A0A8J6HR31_TENMO|nr:hypothetical protein GEV33_003581 [Tenebrio molitor]